MKKFQRKGPGKSTKRLLELLFLQNVRDKTLLDIGGGIGTIQWSFIEKGGRSTLDIDASNGYLEVAKTHAQEKNFTDKTNFMHGDFVDKSSAINSYDFITLDKVLCCYPDYKALLGAVLEKSNQAIALTFPMGGLISKGIAQFMKIYMYFKKNPFRTYIHSPGEIERLIQSRGFYAAHKKISFPWHVQIYIKEK